MCPRVGGDPVCGGTQRLSGPPPARGHGYVGARLSRRAGLSWGRGSRVGVAYRMGITPPSHPYGRATSPCRGGFLRKWVGAELGPLSFSLRYLFLHYPSAPLTACPSIQQPRYPTAPLSVCPIMRARPFTVSPRRRGSSAGARNIALDPRLRGGTALAGSRLILGFRSRRGMAFNGNGNHERARLSRAQG